MLAVAVTQVPKMLRGHGAKVSAKSAGAQLSTAAASPAAVASQSRSRSHSTAARSAAASHSHPHSAVLAARTPALSSHAELIAARRGPPGAAAPAVKPDCPRVTNSPNYVNPLALAHVMRERIDQGVDYGGSGKLGAIGDGTITEVSMENTGWPGAFIVYRLTNGRGAGCLVYYAEGVQPVTGLRPGDTVRAGQAMATIIPGSSSGIEIGWAAPGRHNLTWARTHGDWKYEDDANSVPSAAGKGFSALIKSLGGPPGRIEGGSGH